MTNMRQARMMRGDDVIGLDMVLLLAHKGLGGGLLEASEGEVQILQLFLVVHFVLDDGDEVLKDGKEIDSAGLVAAEGGIEGELGLGDDGAAVEIDELLGGLGHEVVVLDAVVEGLVGGLEGAAGFGEGLGLFGDGGALFAEEIEGDLEVGAEHVHVGHATHVVVAAVEGEVGVVVAAGHVDAGLGALDEFFVAAEERAVGASGGEELFDLRREGRGLEGRWIGKGGAGAAIEEAVDLSGAGLLFAFELDALGLEDGDLDLRFEDVLLGGFADGVAGLGEAEEFLEEVEIAAEDA
jgi:hypothetical protein